MLDPSAPDTDTSVGVFLNHNTELCIVVPSHEERGMSSVVLLPSSGLHQPQQQFEPRADVAGAPLVPGVKYDLVPGTVVTVYAWNNLTIRVEGSTTLIRNIFKNTGHSITRPVIEYHCLLLEQRVASQSARRVGPLTVICGQNTAGKLTIGRSLCNYAARSGWKPLWVDADPGIDQSISIPGSIAAAVTEFPSAVGEVLNQTVVSVSFFVGALQAQTTSKADTTMFVPFTHFFHLLMQATLDRLSVHAQNTYGHSGAVINMPELTDMSGLNFLSEAIEQYGISHVLCVGDEFLFNKLRSRFATNPSVVVDRITPSCCQLPPPQSVSVLPHIFERYFQGDGPTNLFPFRWTKPPQSVTVYEVQDGNAKAPLKPVEIAAVKQFEGCMCGLALPERQNTNLLKFPCVAFARIESVKPEEMSFFTSAITFPTERMVVIVGPLRWITSLGE